MIGPAVSFLAVQPGFALFGIGIGFGGSQLTNVILSDVEPEKSGAASGANSTVRMIGSSLGVAIMSALLSVFTVRHAVDGVRAAHGLSPELQAHAVALIRGGGVNFRPPGGTSPHQLALLQQTLADAISTAARTPLLAATGFVTVGLLLSFLIPPVGPPVDAPPRISSSRSTRPS